FSDARILLFPVATMIGPVWVTCQMVLKDAGINDVQLPDNVEQFITNLDTPENLNFGWLLLERDKGKTIDSQNWNLNRIPEEITNRIVVVSDNLFPQIVNSNLEVRMSVAIDPERGAAEEGALFTYEAIPRGTVFWFDAVYQNPSYFPALSNLNISLGNIENTVKDGLSLFKFLGVGGMGSRGFGRLEILNL
ncbi:type III-B CRISPR module RAMP protein Cmr4, partial [Archaeoglobales archaeon]